MSIGRFGKISRLVGIVASCLAISGSSFAQRGKVIEEPVYPGSILPPTQQAEVVRVYNAIIRGDDNTKLKLLNLSDMIGIEDKFVSEEEERDIVGEIAQFTIYQVERELGRVPDKIDFDLYMQRKIAENPKLVNDELMRAVYEYAFNQLEFKGLRGKNW